MSIYTLRPLLIVDADGRLAPMLRELLAQSGVTDVDLAGSVSGALTQLRARNYRFVISALMVGERSGRDLKTAMALRPAYAETPVLIVAEKAAPADADALAQDVLVAPFDAPALRERIELALADRLGRDQLLFGVQA